MDLGWVATVFVSWGKVATERAWNACVDVFLCTWFSGSGYHHDANLV